MLIVVRRAAPNPSARTITIAKGIVRASRGRPKPMYGMSTPPPMIITGILTGGAIIPRIPAMAIIAPVRSRVIPIDMNTGAAIAPVVKTAAVDEPVIIPADIANSIISTSSVAGRFRNTTTMW